MHYFAQLDGGKVTAISQTTEALVGDNFIEISGYDTSILGATWNGVSFIMPAPVPSYKIAVGSFFDRFGEHAIPVLASANPAVQALIKFITPRAYVDLQRPDLPGALDVIIAAGFSIDKQSILDTPCQPGEEP